MQDYLVVGLGLAGVSFCHVLEQHNKSFTVISDASQQASTVAGGLYNPVILKRFTKAWLAEQQLKEALPFYALLEEKLACVLDYKIPVLRRFTSVEEQNLWFEKADQATLEPFLSPKLLENKNPNIDAPFGYGEVLDTGRIDTRQLLKSYTDYLHQKRQLKETTFNYESLTLHQDHISYEDLKAKQLVFAEGYGLKANPYFKYLPLNGTKGELLTIKAPDLKEVAVIKSSVFIIPLGNDIYRIGATYKWKDKTNTPTAASKEELITKLERFLHCSYEVVDHVAGIRPTVEDRRPLVGKHPKHNHLYVLNGFGSRGVMIAPFAAMQLFHQIEEQQAVHQEMDIARFTAKYYNK